MKIKKSTLYLMGIVLLIILTGYFVMGRNNTSIANVTESDSDKDVQKVVLSIKNYNYYPNTVTVKADKPVRIYLDASVTGCFRSFTIPNLGVAKNLPTPEEYVQFTPTKKGTYKFACSMGMGTGVLIVE